MRNGLGGLRPFFMAGLNYVFSKYVNVINMYFIYPAWAIILSVATGKNPKNYKFQKVVKMFLIP